MPFRNLKTAATFALCGTLLFAACSSDDDESSSKDASSSTTASTEAGPVGGDVTAPVVLSAEETSATVAVGTVVTFDMGEPGEGEFVAVSSDPAVFEVDSTGYNDGSATFNAAGTAVAAGTAEVTVSFRGSTNGVGTPTIFTITVE